MKNIIISTCVMINFICCNSSNRQRDEIQSEDIATRQDVGILPDSLFYKINMGFFDMPSIPYDESVGSQALKVATGTFRQEVIDYIKELEGSIRTNVFYLSKQAENENGFIITVYTENEIDPGSIYLLSLDRELNLTDYRKISYEKCDLEDQTDTCEISFCDVIVAYKNEVNDYTVVHKKEREFNCNDGRRLEVETDSTQLIIKDQKFFIKNL